MDMTAAASKHLPGNPVFSFLYWKLLKQYTQPVYGRLIALCCSGDDDFSFLQQEPPRCDLTPAEPGTASSVNLGETALAGLFFYRFETFYLLPELDETENAWLSPYLEAFVAGQQRRACFTRAQLRYLLWLCENRRVSPERAGALAGAFVRRYNEDQQNILLRVYEPEQTVQEWQACFACYVEAYRQEAAARQAEQEARWAQQRAKAAALQQESRRIVGLLQAYEQDPARCAEKWAPDGNAAVQAEVRLRKLRCTLDADGILWIAGRGKLSRALLQALPDTAKPAIRGAFIGEGITDIDCEAFAGPWGEGLLGVHFPTTLRNIKKMAFYGCEALAWAPLPPHLRYIGEKAFGKCRALTELTLPESMEYLHSRAFSASGLQTRIALPDGTKVIV